MGVSSILILFVKNPELGKAKTRLAATIGDEKALIIYKELLSHTSKITQKGNFDKAVYYSSFIDENDFFDTRIFQKNIQHGIDLGDKMKNAFEECINQGYKNICIIGSDCYDLNNEIIQQAFEQLQTNDAVIGPAKDGGYYLLGLSKYTSVVFKGKKWSTSSVLNDTILDFQNNQLSYATLPTLSDIDVFEDLGDLSRFI